MEIEELTHTTTEIVIAYVGHNQVEPGELPGLISGVYAALSALGATTARPEQTYEPAVSIRSSVKPDHLVSLIDGKPYKMLKRHLAQNGLTPDEYRARYGLPANYPMVAANYSAKRAEIAKQIGLGRKLGQKVKKAV